MGDGGGDSGREKEVSAENVRDEDHPEVEASGENGCEEYDLEEVDASA